MESQPQNPEFRNNPENFHPCIKFYSPIQHWLAHAGLSQLFHLSWVN